MNSPLSTRNEIIPRWNEAQYEGDEYAEAIPCGQGRVISTEVGYDVYVGSIYVADVSTFAAALAALKGHPLWNGRYSTGVSPSRVCP